MLYLKSLTIENVRCFGKKQKIDFTGENGKISQWTVILGDNGTGKTTILRGIVGLLPSPQLFFVKRNRQLGIEYEPSLETDWKKLWQIKHKNGENNSKMTLNIVDSEAPFGEINPFELELKYSINHITTDVGFELSKKVGPRPITFPPLFCFAYGANRKMGNKSLSGDKLLEANETLFNDESLLQNSEEYFLQMDYDRAFHKNGNKEIDRVKEMLKKILPSGVKDIRVFETGRLQKEVQVETSFGWVAINELSLGYKTTIAWLIDFATKMMYYHNESRNPFDEPTILVLDEIDLHMHPAWQKEIIENLTKLFPNTQFIVTAHSPLIAQAALDSNLVLLKRKNDEVNVINEPNIIKTWRIDQVLTSDLFGLKESRNHKIEKVFKQRRILLLKDELNAAEKDKLQELEGDIDEIPVAETQEYIKAMEIVLKASKQVG